MGEHTSDVDNPLILKLSDFIELSRAETTELKAWASGPKRFGARRSLIHPDDRPQVTCLMLEGWACRYKQLRDGNRQIVGVLLPGDTCDLHGFLLHQADHGITLLSEATVALLESEAVSESLDRYPRLMKAMWWSSIVEEGITREWLVNVGRRDAVTRLAHLICELWFRAERVGLVIDRSFHLPMTQTDLGDALGLTAVHTNRVVRALREKGLASIKARSVEIPSIDKLMMFADFNPTYLQRRPRPSY